MAGVVEAGQLARLVDLAEPLVQLVIILPGPPDPQVISYWDKLLEVRESAGSLSVSVLTLGTSASAGPIPGP